VTLALITGAHGFLGQNLARFLSLNGRTVAGVGHGAWPHANERGVKRWLNGDIDRDNLDIILADVGLPETIFHLAGGSLVGTSFSAPLEDFRRSVESTARLLDWVKEKCPGSPVVYVSSAAVYGSGYTEPIHEREVAAPQSPYGFHKLIAETVCQSYAFNFGLKISIVRLFSLYGAGLYKQLLWDICVRLNRGESPLTLSGSGNERRDWIHVSDAVRLLLIGETIADKRPAVLNGGTGVPTTVAQFARMITEEWGADQAIFSGSTRAGDPPSLVSDVSFARSLGFEPQKRLEQGVKETVAWFRRDGRTK
jgi:UDP-glucose 4-epimerase